MQDAVLVDSSRAGRKYMISPVFRSHSFWGATQTAHFLRQEMLCICRAWAQPPGVPGGLHLHMDILTKIVLLFPNTKRSERLLYFLKQRKILILNCKQM